MIVADKETRITCMKKYKVDAATVARALRLRNCNGGIADRIRTLALSLGGQEVETPLKKVVKYI